MGPNARAFEAALPLKAHGPAAEGGQYNAEQMLQDTQGELQFSETLLAAAQVEEAAKLALQLKADARMAAAAAEEVSAIASCKNAPKSPSQIGRGFRVCVCVCFAKGVGEG